MTQMTTILLQATIGDKAGTYSHDYSWECPIPETLGPMQRGLLAKGFIEILRDASSTCKAKNEAGLAVDPTPEQRNEAGLERLDKLKAGSYVFGRGGGGGGARMSVQVAAWINWLREKKPVTFKGEVPNSKNLEKYQLALTSKAIWPRIAKILAPMTDAERRAFHREKLPALVRANMPQIVAQIEADPTRVSKYIKDEEARRAGRKLSDDFELDDSFELAGLDE